MILSLQKCDIASILLSLIHFFLPLAESRGMTIKYHSIPDSLILLLDQEKIEKVISNLISNAIKYSDTAKKTNNVIISVVTHPDKALINIQDNGIGMTRRQVKRVFDRFYQADSSLSRQADGTGPVCL